MERIRLTMAQALVRFLDAQYVELDGVENKFVNGIFGVWGRGDDYIVVTGIIDTVAIQKADQGAVTVARKMPNMDYIVESENRLWGCRYGDSIDGQIVNEIYACKLGDFKNWQCFF